MNDELPAHSAPPKPGLDYTDHGGIPAFCDRRQAKANGTAEPSYLDLVEGRQ